jgi:hypothetical protein
MDEGGMIQVQTVRPDGAVVESRVFPQGVRLSCEEGGFTERYRGVFVDPKWTRLWVEGRAQLLKGETLSDYVGTFTPYTGGTLEISYAEAA